MIKFVKAGKHSFMMKAKLNKAKSKARKSSTVCQGEKGKEQEDEGKGMDEECKGKDEESKDDNEEGKKEDEGCKEEEEKVEVVDVQEPASGLVVHGLSEGDFVRMTAEVDGKEKLLGVRCKVVTVGGEAVLLDPQADMMFIKHWVPVQAVVKLLPGEVQMKDLRNMVHVSRHEKQNLLARSGITDEVAGVLDDVVIKGNVMHELTDWHIDLFEACARWSLQMIEQVADYLPMRFGRLLIEGHTGTTQDLLDEGSIEQVQAKHELRLKFFRRKFKETEMLVMPVWHRRMPGLGRHFTLLVVRKSPELQVQYIDSLPKVHTGCLAHAEAFLEMLEVPAVEATLLRINKGRQTGVECGYFVCHYMEDVFRVAAGQGRGRQGWPNPLRLLAIRHYLGAVSKSLHDELSKWCKDKAATDVRAILSEAESEAIAKRWLKAKGSWKAAQDMHCKLA